MINEMLTKLGFTLPFWIRVIQVFVQLNVCAIADLICWQWWFWNSYFSCWTRWATCR